MFHRKLAAVVLSSAFAPVAAYSHATGEIKLQVTDPSGASLRTSGRL